MRDSLRTTVGQFSSAGGRALTRAANARAVEPAADLPAAARGNFYVLVEVTGSEGGHAALYRQMLNAAQVAFYEAEGSVASALVRAVRSAHIVLRRANEALPDAGWRAGISCVALQGHEATIAQAGPALVLVSHPRTIDQFPADNAESSLPLGGEERPEVELIRTSIEPGSILLLGQSEWMRQVPPEALAAAVTAESVPQVVEYLGQLAGELELSALVVSVGGAVGALQGAPTVPLAQDRAGRVLSRESGAALRGGPVDELAVADAPAAVGAPTPVEADKESSAAAPEPPARPHFWAGRPSAARPPGTRRSTWPLLLAVVIIPILIAALVFSMWWLRTRARETQLNDLLSGATSAITDAGRQPDESAARLRLDSARDFLDKARLLKRDDSRIPTIQTKYNEAFDRVNHVMPLYGVVPLWDFRESGQRLERLLVNSTSLFVLDRGRLEVGQFTLSELGDSLKPADPYVIIRKGQQVGDLVVSDLVDIAWVDAVSNQRSKLLALDSAGGLVGFDMTWGATKLNIGGRERWGYPQLIATYNGNLYVVDSRSNQVWRYRPGDNGYQNAPERYFAANTQLDLAGVQSVAIDGNLWLLYADGRLLKFFAGEQKPFELKGLPQPLNAPMAIAAQAEGSYIYIADSGNGRIVEFTKEGEFKRQFRPAQGDLFKDMRSIFLPEDGSLFYILTTDKLYKADLPRAGVGITADS